MGANVQVCKPLKACEEFKSRKNPSIKQVLNLLRSNQYQVYNKDMTKVISWSKGNYIYSTSKFTKIISQEKVIELLMSTRFNIENIVRSYHVNELAVI